MTKTQRITRTIADFIRYTEWRTVFLIATIGFVLGFAFGRMTAGNSAQTKPIETGSIAPEQNRQTNLQGTVLASSIWPELVPVEKNEYATTKNCEWVTDADEQDMINILKLENWMLEQDGEAWIEKPSQAGYVTTWLDTDDYSVSTLWWNASEHKPVVYISCSKEYMKKLGPWLRKNAIPYTVESAEPGKDRVIEIYGNYPTSLP